MSVLSEGSSKDIDYLDEDSHPLMGSGGLPIFSSGHHKEGRLKVVPADVTYATFAPMGPTEIYDKMCSLVHFGHISNRILRKMIHAGFLDASCGNTLGKNRKTKSEQRKLFDNLSSQGLLYLHKIIKSELEGVDIKDDVSITADKIVGTKRPLHESAASSSSSVPPKQPFNNEFRKVDHISKSELIEAIQEAFNGSKAMELAQASLAKEKSERKQNAIKFLQDQLKEGNKLTAAKKKEFEVKLEELLSTICMEL